MSRVPHLSIKIAAAVVLFLKYADKTGSLRITVPESGENEKFAEISKTIFLPSIWIPKIGMD